MPNIRFRPHHFLCTLGFEGKGYSDTFVANYGTIARSLRETPGGDETEIDVVESTDSICTPCPNRRGERCDTEAKIRSLDVAHAKILEIQPGDRLTWGEAKIKIKTKMTLKKLKTACAPCAWLKAGMCEKALSNLRGTTSLLAFLICTMPILVHADGTTDGSIKGIESRKSALRFKLIGKGKVSKAARTLEKALRLLDAEKFEEAIKTAAPLENEAEFADHALAIEGIASIRSAESEVARFDETKTKPNWTKIEADAVRAEVSWTKISERFLYSPWWGSATKEMGKSELVLALAKFSKRKPIEAVRLFEKAFQRLTLENALFLIRPRHLEAYGELCLKKPSELCRSWVVKFANHYAKNTIESKSLGKKFPDLVDAAKPTFANSKVTTGYKQKDADEESFDQIFPMILEEKWAHATDALLKFLEEYPRSAHRYRARYWLARALSVKNTKDAEPHFQQLIRETPLTLYGLLAALEMKQEIEGRFKGSATDLLDLDELQTPIEASRLGRVKKLLAAKADRLAATDLRAMKSRDTAPGPYLFWLASLASSAGSHLTSFSILSDLIARMDEIVYSAEGLDLVFPVVDWSVIEKQATAAGIDPVLILSLIKQESAFDREASSSVGASGYMQLMPFTAADIEADVERRDLIEAETNIRIGSKYLKKLLDRYKGNIALSLAAYNSGPTAVDRWIREGRASRSFLEFVEQIPYKETRDYVGTIYRNYVWYKLRLHGERMTTTDFFWPAPVKGQ